MDALTLSPKWQYLFTTSNDSLLMTTDSAGSRSSGLTSLRIAEVRGGCAMNILGLFVWGGAAVAQWLRPSNIFWNICKSTSEWRGFETRWFYQSGFEFAKTPLLILNH